MELEATPTLLVLATVLVSFVSVLKLLLAIKRQVSDRMYKSALID